MGYHRAANKGSASPPRALCHILQQRIVPGKRQARHADLAVVPRGSVARPILHTVIPQLRFIGKEAREGVAKIPLVVLPMRLINGFDQCGYAFRVDGMEIVFLTAENARARFVIKEHAPHAFRHIKAQAAVANGRAPHPSIPRSVPRPVPSGDTHMRPGTRLLPVRAARAA